MRRLLILALAVLLGLAVTPAAAQEAGTLELGQVDTTDFPAVRLHATTPRSLGGAALPADAFTVREDGQQRAVEVEPIAAQELEVVLVVDASGSMGTAPMAAAREAATGFVRQMPPGVEIAVVAFDDEPEVVAPLSDDHEATIAAIAEVVSGGRTALYDSVVAAVGELSDQPAQRAIVLLSDGGDNNSEASLDAAIGALDESAATVFAIELVTPETDLATLERLAGATGGTTVSAADPPALAGVYDDIAAKLVSQYRLTFASESSGGPVELEVTVAHEGVLATATVRATMPTPAPAETEAEQVAPVVPRGSLTTPGLFAEPWILIAGAAAFYAAIVLVVLLLLAPRKRHTQLEGAARGGARGPGLPRMTDLSEQAIRFAERLLRKQGRQGRLDTALERAGIRLRGGEFAVLVLSACVVAFVFGTVVGNVAAGIALLLGVLVASRLTVSVMASRRQSRFAEQLGDTLQLLAGTLRAGYGLVQAVDTVAHEADAPTSEEFKRIVMETRLGRGLDQALQACAARMRSEDFDWVVQAMDIHREVGGDLAEVLDNVAETVRERNQVRGQIKALSAEGRLSAVILSALPFVMALLLSIVSPGYINELFTSGIGRIMAATAAVLMIIGALWLRRIVRLVF